MKKSIITFLLLGLLLVPFLILAQEQAQTYSGLDRFVDNVKMFFSFGDKKVKLALEIREKEVNSAIENIRNGNDVDAAKNIERARKRIQLVQKKVSLDVAEEVKTSVDKIVDKINAEENLPDNFEVYVLEEEKTQLTAELVIEVEGKEGQTLTREIVKDGESGKNKVEIIVEGDNKQTKVVEIEGKIGQIDNQIVERIFAVGTKGIGESGVIIEGDKTGVKIDNNGGKRVNTEVKTHTVGDGTEKNDPLPEPDLDKFNPDLYNPNARAPGDIIEDDDWVEKNEIVGGGKNCGNGVECGGNRVIEDKIIDGSNNVVDDTVDPGPEGIVGSG